MDKETRVQILGDTVCISLVNEKNPKILPLAIGKW